MAPGKFKLMGNFYFGEHPYLPKHYINKIYIHTNIHNSDTVSVHFNHFYCMGIYDKLSRHLYMLTYIYLNVDEC